MEDRTGVTSTLLFSAKELAQELRVSVSTIERMDSAGKLPRPLRIGSRGKRWSRQTVADWLAAGAPPRAEWEAFKRRA